MARKNTQNLDDTKEPLSDKAIAEFHRAVANRVAILRKERGLSQLDLSLAIGYKSVSLVAGAEAGYKNIHFNLEQLYRIASALDVDMAEFFKFE
ncbi:helix-turn-helix domain-containing protein [Helicobacter sp. 23-1044]